MTASLAELFDARSVAILGASNNPRKASCQVMRTMLSEGYRGQIYPVNPQQEQILGRKCYRSLDALDQPVDLLVISVPAHAVKDILLEAAGRRDVRGAVILSAGFAETNIPENVQLEKEIVAICREAGIRVVGPNCIGLINSETKLCTSFAPGMNLKPGNIGFITQSGAFGGAFLMQLGDQPEPLGFSKFAHVGNMSDVSNIEMLAYLGQDRHTSVIAVYMEGVQQGRELLDCASTVTRQKPVFVLKVGRTEIGSHATFSHTGTLAGRDQVYDAAFKQSGMVRVRTLEELVDACKAGSMGVRPSGERICILTEAGGPGIIAMDEIGAQRRVKMAALQSETCQGLKAMLPSMAMVCQPNGYVDMTAAAMAEEHAEALRLVLEDPGVDMVVLISVPPTFLPAIEVADKISAVIQAYNKPVAVCLMRGAVMNEARKHLEQHGTATFDTPDRAVRAMIHLNQAVSHLSNHHCFKEGE